LFVGESGGRLLLALLRASIHEDGSGEDQRGKCQREQMSRPAIVGRQYLRKKFARNSNFDGMIVHLIDGTYELFRHFYGHRRYNQGKDKPYQAVAGVLHSVLEMVETGATHIGVATDHIIESFRNDLWPDYKTGEGIEPNLLAQFQPLEDGLKAMGVAVWPMVELEADDGLASAAQLASDDQRVDKVCIWANDKDLAQCVRDDRVVQIIRKGMQIRNAEAVRKKFGVEPELIPDLLALVGDAQDGYPGIRGIGPSTAVALLNRHGPIEAFPDGVLGGDRERAVLFKTLATLRTDAPLFADVDELEWRGPTPAFAGWPERMDDKRIQARLEKAVRARSAT
jgi:5'-3' exonuclease